MPEFTFELFKLLYSSEVCEVYVLIFVAIAAHELGFRLPFITFKLQFPTLWSANLVQMESKVAADSKLVEIEDLRIYGIEVVSFVLNTKHSFMIWRQFDITHLVMGNWLLLTGFC